MKKVAYRTPLERGTNGAKLAVLTLKAPKTTKNAKIASLMATNTLLTVADSLAPNKFKACKNQTHDRRNDVGGQTR